MRLPASLQSESGARYVVRLMQAGIVVTLLTGLAVRSIPIIVNATLALIATFLPALLSRDHGVQLSPLLTLWLTGTLLLHAIGMVGPYSTLWWWDHLTHTLSASLVAGVGYTTARAIDIYSESIYLPPNFLFVYVLLFTLAVGVVWEILEFAAREIASATGQDPLLVQYGLEDTILDLLFDAIGAVIVALFGTPLFRDVVESLVIRLRRSSE